MFKNKYSQNNNICGKAIFELRKKIGKDFSQRQLAERMQLEGIDLDKNAIQRIEGGKRFVTDIELKGFLVFFGVSSSELLK